MKLTDNVLKNFHVVKVFKDNNQKINYLSFSANGENLITSSDDDSIIIYDCQNGVQKKTLNSKKYGVNLIHYTHTATTVVHSSTKVDDGIRYLSLHDNKYIRYFQGHTAKVVALCMSPVDDTFLSGSEDKTIRLWDLRSQNCQGLMHVPSRPVAAFDPEGLIFAAGINSESVKLYDLRSFDKGPFSTFKLEHVKDCEWTCLKFSADGKMILITTNGSTLHLIDAFQGNPLQKFVGHNCQKGSSFEASFTPDSAYVVCGSLEGKVHFWNTETSGKAALLSQEETVGPLQCAQFNPKYMMMATANTVTSTGHGNLSLWLPKVDEP